MYVLTYAVMFLEVNMNHIELLCYSVAASKVLTFCFCAVISPASWREGQKLVKMVLGPVPRLPREDRSPPDDRLSRTGVAWRPKLLPFYTCHYTPILYYHVSSFHDPNS